jgi:hypothetical protein
MSYCFRCCLLLLFCLKAGTALAQQYTLSGKITEAKGTAIPFSSVYVHTTTQGTSSNIDGQYKLSLPKGQIELLFSAVGYEDRKITLTIAENTTLDVVLAPKIFTLNDVVIKSSNENRAEEIIKKVITKRSVLLNEVQAFSAEVYTKAMQKLHKAPKTLFW